MSYVKIWIHAVWTVKDRQPVLSQDIRQKVFEHIHQNAVTKEIMMEIVNSHHNHVHCLFRLKNNQTIENVMQLIKGESSYWFNKSDLSNLKLNWQKEYFAVSVSESQVEKSKIILQIRRNITEQNPGMRNMTNLFRNMVFRLLKAKTELFRLFNSPG